MKWLFSSKKELQRKIDRIENEVIMREQQKHFDEKMELINEYEGKILSESKKAADDRQYEMMVIVDEKDQKIRQLELKIIDMKNDYRGFNEEVQDYNVIAQKLNIDIKTAMTIMHQLSGRFETMKYEMNKVCAKVDKKDRKLIEAGKGL